MLRLRHLTLPYLKKIWSYTHRLPVKPNQTKPRLRCAQPAPCSAPRPLQLGIWNLTLGGHPSRCSACAPCRYFAWDRASPPMRRGSFRLSQSFFYLFIYYWFFVWVSYSRVLYLVLVSWTVSVSKPLGCATAYRHGVDMGGHQTVPGS